MSRHISFSVNSSPVTVFYFALFGDYVRISWPSVTIIWKNNIISYLFQD